MLWLQVRNMNKAIITVVASAQMSANSMLSEFDIRVIAVIQDHELYVAKDILNWVIVGTTFGQANPVHLQVTHHLTGAPRLAGMSAVLVKSYPERGFRIPATQATHELTDILSAFAWQEHPMHLSASGIITDEQVKVPTCFLVAQQHQTFRCGIAPPTVGFHGDRFDIEKQKMPTAGQMPENPAQAS